MDLKIRTCEVFFKVLYWPYVKNRLQVTESDELRGTLMTSSKKERFLIAGVGALVGIVSVLLVFFGNPANMGFCIACFLRDTAGALGLHQTAAVQYLRPEIIGLILGSFFMALGRKEFAARGGSSPMTRFVLGFFVAIGCLMFLGCPLRMVLRLAGGDGNALWGLAGFVMGILCGIFFLNHGYSLKRTYKQSFPEGTVLPIIEVLLLVLLVTAPALLHFTEAGAGPGGNHAPLLISLCAGLILGALAQRTRLCMVAGIRDFVLFREWTMLLGFAAILVSAFVCNLLASFWNPGFTGQPLSHTDGLWNALGMLLAGFGCVLLGGCPLRQLILSGEGNTDSAVTVLGLLAGGAFAHNFGLASSAGGPTTAGKAAVVIGLAVVCLIACVNTFVPKKQG